MVISKQLLLLQGATFYHLIFMQNVTEGLPPTEKAQVEARLCCSLFLPLETCALCCPQLRSIYKLLVRK
jgi:hypothetical protein